MAVSMLGAMADFVMRAMADFVLSEMVPYLMDSLMASIAFAFQGNLPGDMAFAFQRDLPGEMAFAFQGNLPGDMAFAFQGDLPGEMTGYNWMGETDDSSGEEDWLMVEKTQRETAKEKQTDDSSGEEIDYNEGEEDLYVQDELYRYMVPSFMDSLMASKVPSFMDSLMASKLLFPRRISMPNLHKRTNKTEMKKDTKEVGENETFVSERSDFEEKSVTSAHRVSIYTGENIKKGEGDSHSLRAESIIGKDGGTLEIPNTGVRLKIPPGALRCDYCIRMRIIPHHHLDETEISFASNSSVVVELLPNNVKLLKPATLTLPHCMVLKKKCGWKARVYSSHHKEGTRPQWEEETNTQCDVTYETCVMRLYNFCWKKVEIGDQIVEAKKIVLFAAKDSLSTQNVTYLDIGYYWHLPSCQQVLKMNRFIVLKEMPVVFYKKGQLPLTISFEKVVPPNWTYNEENHNKEISFNTVAITEGSFCTFLLNKMASDETEGYACYFKAGQRSDLVDLIFPLTESGLSRTEAIIPSTGNATAEETHEEHQSAIVKTEEIVVSDAHLQKLSKKIGDNWRDVGRNLKLTEEQIKNHEQKGYPNLKETIYQMLLEWKQKRASAATYVDLADALKKAERLDLQEYLLKKYKKRKQYNAAAAIHL